MKGDGAIPVIQVDIDGFGQGIRQLAESLFERAFKSSPLIGRDRLLGNQQREKFTLGDLDRGERSHFLGIIKPMLDLIIFNGQVEPAAHEFDIPLDRFGGNLQFPRNIVGIGIGVPEAGTAILSFTDDLMDAEHALLLRTSGSFHVLRSRSEQRQWCAP